MSRSSIVITAPDTAEQGAVVPMSTLVTNITAVPRLFEIKLYAMRDIYTVPTSEETIGSVEVTIGAGQSQLISGTFIMPAWDAIVLVMVYIYGPGDLALYDYWDFDGYATKVVSLLVPEVPTGIITKVEIAVNGVQMVPPVPGVEVDEDFLMHVWAKNTSTESMKMGLRYVITTPTGATIERRVDELWPYTGAGQIHHFVEGKAGPEARFDIDEPGEWLLNLYLYGDDILIDMTDMVMFTAAGEPPPDPVTLLGEIVSVEIMTETWVGSDVLSLPASIQTDTKFRLRVIGLNKTSESLRLGLRYVITKPDGNTISDEMMEAWPYTGGDKQHEFVEPGVSWLTVDQSGEWNLKVELLGGSDKQVLDTWEGVMVQATVEPPEPGGVVLIQDYTYPDAPSYVGQSVEECTFSFSALPEQIPGSGWVRDQAIQAFTDKVEEKGGHMVKLRVWEDTTPILTTNYTVEATSTASPLPWTAIIIGVLAILFLIALTFAILQIRTFLWGEDGEPPDGFGDLMLLMIMMLVMQMMMSIMDEISKEGFMPTAVKYVEKAKEVVTPIVKKLKRG